MRLRLGGSLEGFFLAMHGVNGDDIVFNIELLQQFLRRRYLVGFLVNFDMRQHQRRIGGKSTEDLSGLGIVEGVETTLSALPSSATMRMPAGASLRFRSAACSRKTFSTSSGFRP